MKDPKSEGKRWLEQAARDLEAAETNSRENLWWIACFLAQQAAEKAVKAFLYWSGERLVLGHSVVELLKEAAKKDPLFGNLVADGSKLDRFYIPTRYPNGLPGGIPAETYDVKDAREALESAGAIVAAVENSIGG